MVAAVHSLLGVVKYSVEFVGQFDLAVRQLGWQAEGPQFDSDTRFGSPFSSERLWFVDTVSL